MVSFLLLYRCKICIIRRIQDRRYTEFVSAVKGQKICPQVWLLDLLWVIYSFGHLNVLPRPCIMPVKEARKVLLPVETEALSSTYTPKQLNS
jgi:hypothetical protein